MGRTVDEYVHDLKRPIVDTIPVFEYVGIYPRIIFILNENYSIELTQSMSKEEVKLATNPFDFNLYKNLKIKCIFLTRKGKIIKNCGCKEDAEWRNSRN